MLLVQGPHSENNCAMSQILLLLTSKDDLSHMLPVHHRPPKGGSLLHIVTQGHRLGAILLPDLQPTISWVAKEEDSHKIPMPLFYVWPISDIHQVCSGSISYS